MTEMYGSLDAAQRTCGDTQQRKGPGCRIQQLLFS